jgi:hypothetical protein
MFNGHLDDAKIFVGIITEKVTISALYSKKTSGIRIFGIQIRSPQIRYIAQFDINILFYDHSMPYISYDELNISEELFNKLRVGDKKQVIFHIYQTYTENWDVGKRLIPMKFKCPERQEALDLS